MEDFERCVLLLKSMGYSAEEISKMIVENLEKSFEEYKATNHDTE